ncbi:MAG TPA: TauD/TfdA family dioxygenase [Rhodopila sp.]|uniref:TauD/TfdA dioxygenase family protein n=1 Tax=Rhodopila sp. TaxID=2480087 RepID=UPI002B67C401|nr:TauD/TfdA family dioxygenase [Rhodopila sp.]HVY18154.1 TauD/TfdA family dioxygenase [Rhodopila sp.]
MTASTSAQMTCIPLDGPFEAEIRAIDLAVPMEAETFDAIRHAFHQHAVLLFRDQDLTPAQHIAFSRRFGALEEHVQIQFPLPGHPEVFIVSNKSADNKPVGATNCELCWRSDHSYHALPNLGSLFHAREVPEVGGETLLPTCTRPMKSCSPCMIFAAW